MANQSTEVARSTPALSRFSAHITRLFKGRQFFIGLMTTFLAESLWIAFSAAYPQAFDEDYHFGLIQIYAHHWLPFLNSQPPGADQFGAITRDPSYLYHYLMSFPYRLINLFVHDQSAQVIILRLLNIGLFALGIVLFRRVLLRARVSSAFTNVSVCLFILIPIVPQLAAQINYDNLLLPLVAWVCLLTFDVVEALQKRRPMLRTLLVLLAVCLLTSLVKYPFLPIFVAVFVFIGLHAWREFRTRPAELGRRLAEDYKRMSRRTRTLLGLLLIVSFGLFAQRYVVNLVTYKEPIPDCASVLSVQRCSAYSPWARDYQYSLNHEQPANVAVYLAEWFYGLWFRLFFAVNGRTSGYTNYPSLPLPSATAIILALASSVALAMFWRQVFRKNNYLAFFLLISVFYCGALLLDNYLAYRRTGQPVAVNGRYLLPVLLPIAAILGRAISLAAQRRPQLKPVLAAAVILLFLEGGGVLTFISRSDSSWYWQNSVVQRVNTAAHKFLSPILVESGNKFY